MSTSGILSQVDRNKLIEIFANHAAFQEGGSAAYFRRLILASNLPDRWKRQRLNLRGSADLDSQDLIYWAMNQGVNPDDPRYTTLGSLLQAAFDDFGLEERRYFAALIVAHRLYRDEALLSQVVQRYQVPQPAGAVSVQAPEFGPEIDWRGPTEQIQLQSWLIPEPDFQDVGFLKRAIDRAASVCRVEFPHHSRRGTGFLIAPDLVLTNYHVLKEEPGEDLEANARSAVLLFGKITAEPGKEAEGQAFRLVEDLPIVSASPVEQLDYVLLRVEPGIQSAQGIAPAPFSVQALARGDALHILQHPEGKALQLAVSGNGVEYVAEERGLVQYSTRAAGGSSGSPCFSDNWEVVAIHHAQRSKGFGIVREGILFASIHELIKGFFS